MLPRTLIALAALCAPLALFAQAQLGTLTQSQGLVTVTVGTTGGTAGAGTALVEGMTVITSGTATATLTLASGCSIPLQPNQSVTITSANCSQLVVQNLGPTVAGTAGGFTGFTAGAWSAGTMLVLGPQAGNAILRALSSH